MKKSTLLFLFLVFFSLYSHAQSNCIDYIIYQVETSSGNTTDTLVCRIMSEDENTYTVDNGFAITTISKSIVLETIPCVRKMSNYEIYRFRGIDDLTKDYFDNSNTAGNYLRKASFNAYVSTGLAVFGSAGIILGITTFKDHRSQNAWIIGGSIFSAAALFFTVLSWNNVYKAGKLMDLNNKTALYLAPTQDGNLGLSIKF